MPSSLHPSHSFAHVSVQDQADSMSGMSLLAGKALSSARMSDILSQTSLTGSQQLQQREESGQRRLPIIPDQSLFPASPEGAFVLQYVMLKGSFMQRPATLPPAPVICFSLTSPLTCSTAWSRLESSTGGPHTVLHVPPTSDLFCLAIRFSRPVTPPPPSWRFLSFQV